MLVTWGWHGTFFAGAYCVLAAAMIALSLIEISGERTPLSVAAIGTALAVLIIVVASAVRHDWWVAGGSLIGTAVATVVYLLLRTADPSCQDPRGHGRSALLIVGCWAGGLGLRPTAIGAGAWIVVYFLCMVGAWSTVRRLAPADRLTADPERTLRPWLATPLVSSLGVAMAVSLVAAR
jgi:hypothetical protein